MLEVCLACAVDEDWRLIVETEQLIAVQMELRSYMGSKETSLFRCCTPPEARILAFGAPTAVSCPRPCAPSSGGGKHEKPTLKCLGDVNSVFASSMPFVISLSSLATVIIFYVGPFVNFVIPSWLRYCITTEPASGYQ